MFTGSKYIYEVYKEQSFTKAAKNLYISQPSLSSNVRKVEERLGVELFDRSSLPIRLTEYGEEYIRCVEQIQALEEHFTEFLNNTKEAWQGKLSIGGSPHFISFVLPKILIDYKATHPLVEITICEGDSNTLAAHLADGTLDLAIDMNLMDSALFEPSYSFEERLIMAVPKEFEINNSLTRYALTAEDIEEQIHRRSNVPHVPIEPFRNVPFILLTPGNRSRQQAEQLFSMSGFHPNIVLQMEHQYTAFTLAQNGIGAVIISDTIVQSVPKTDALVYYKLPDNISRQSIFFYYKRNKYLTPAMQQFLAFSKQLLSSLM